MSKKQKIELLQEIKAEIIRTEENLGPEATVADYASDVMYRIAYVYFGGANARDAVSKALSDLDQTKK